LAEPEQEELALIPLAGLPVLPVPALTPHYTQAMAGLVEKGERMLLVERLAAQQERQLTWPLPRGFIAPCPNYSALGRKTTQS